MSTRSERDKQKSTQDRLQLILSQLLKDEDNKYCVDCDAKGPRWASWNLGIFLCIRCAGIHRNLGVHISKVKSVNLDSWTSEQTAMVQEMGNSRARAVYEANLPDNFRRPQTDSGLEAFIRGKYEQKRYIAREWIPPKPKMQPTYVEEPKKEKKRPKPKTQTTHNLPVTAAAAPQAETKAAPSKPEPPKPVATPAADLLSLDDPIPETNGDIFGDFIGSNAAQPTSEGLPIEQSGNAAPTVVQNAENHIPADGVDLFGETSGGEQQRKAQKEDILKLYGSATSSSSPQMFGVPGGMYMPQQQVPQQQMMPNNMMPNNVAMMNMQQQQQHQQQQQPMMMAQHGQAGGMQQQQVYNMGMVQGTGGMAMMPGQQYAAPQQQSMYNNMGTPAMYHNMQPPQYQQVQAQMATMNLGPAAAVGFQQQPTPIAAGGTAGGNYNNSWGGQPMGQTLSGNLWK